MAITGCSGLGAGSAATSTPFQFVTASPLPVSTLPPVTPSLPPSPTPTVPTPQPTLRGSPLAPTVGPSETPLPPGSALPGPDGSCPVAPQGGFGTIFESDPGLPSALGCPTSPDEDEAPQAWIADSRWQTFERGALLWVSQVGWEVTPAIYAIYEDGSYQRLDDTFDPDTDPLEGEEVPPPGLFEPVSSLGKAWREGPGVSARLGWATAPESSDLTWTQAFSNGEMIVVVPQGQTYVFKHGSPDTWQTYDVSF